MGNAKFDGKRILIVIFSVMFALTLSTVSLAQQMAGHANTCVPAQVRNITAGEAHKMFPQIDIKVNKDNTVTITPHDASCYKVEIFYDYSKFQKYLVEHAKDKVVPTPFTLTVTVNPTTNAYVAICGMCCIIQGKPKCPCY